MNASSVAGHSHRSTRAKNRKQMPGVIRVIPDEWTHREVARGESLALARRQREDQAGAFDTIRIEWDGGHRRSRRTAKNAWLSEMRQDPIDFEPGRAGGFYSGAEAIGALRSAHRVVQAAVRSALARRRRRLEAD